MMKRKICFTLILIGSLFIIGCNKDNNKDTEVQPTANVEDTNTNINNMSNSDAEYDVENINIDKAGEIVKECRNLCNITYSTIAQTDKINCWITLEGNKQELLLHKAEITNLIKTIPNYKTITIRLTESGMAYPFSDEKIIK